MVIRGDARRRRAWRKLDQLGRIDVQVAHSGSRKRDPADADLGLAGVGGVDESHRLRLALRAPHGVDGGGERTANQIVIPHAICLEERHLAPHPEQTVYSEDGRGPDHETDRELVDESHTPASARTVRGRGMFPHLRFEVLFHRWSSLASDPLPKTYLIDSPDWMPKGAV